MIRKYRYVYRGNKGGFDNEIVNTQKNDNSYFPLRSRRSKEIKDKVFELRRFGKSYGDISKELSVPKSTLSLWFRKSPENFNDIKKANIEKGRISGKERLFEITQQRKLALFQDYDRAIKEAGQEFIIYKDEPLFVAGLMLYSGEGDMTSRHHIRLSNSDWKLHDVFLRFLEKYLLFTRQKVHLQLLAYPDHDLENIKKHWAEKLAVTLDQFHKTQVMKGKGKKQLQFGVGMSIINNTRAKYKLREWIDLRIKEIQNAGMV